MGIKQGSYAFLFDLRPLQFLLFLLPLFQPTTPPVKFRMGVRTEAAPAEERIDFTGIGFGFFPERQDVILVARRVLAGFSSVAYTIFQLLKRSL